MHLYSNSVKLAGDRPFLGTREKVKKEDGTTELGDYKWISYDQGMEKASAVAKYLMEHKLSPKIKFDDGEFRTIALYAKNREEWVITDLACAMTNITTVTLYDTLGRESLEFILDQT